MKISVNNLIKARRYMVGSELRKYDDCIAIAKENGTYVALWLEYDLKDKHIMCYSGHYPKTVRGFYPMTKAGVKQAYHDVREYAHYTKS